MKTRHISNANRFFIFVGIGLFAGNALQNIWQYHDDAVAFACVMISGGAALVIYYFIAAKKLKESPQEERHSQEGLCIPVFIRRRLRKPPS